MCSFPAPVLMSETAELTDSPVRVGAAPATPNVPVLIASKLPAVVVIETLTLAPLPCALRACTNATAIVLPPRPA